MEEKQLWRIVVILGEPTTQEDAGNLQEHIAILCEDLGYDVMTVAEPNVDVAALLQRMYNPGKEE